MCIAPLDLRPATFLDLLERVASAAPGVSRNFCKLTNGTFERPGWESKPYPPSDCLKQALQVAQCIDADGVARSAEPARIKEAVFQTRAAAVAEWPDLGQNEI